MRTGLFRTAALLALAFACTASAAEPRVGKYVKYDAGEFVIILSRSAGQTSVEKLVATPLFVFEAREDHGRARRIPCECRITVWIAQLGIRDFVAGSRRRDTARNAYETYKVPSSMRRM